MLLPRGCFSPAKAFDPFGDDAAQGLVVSGIKEVAVNHWPLVIESVTPKPVSGVHDGPE